MKSEIIDGKMFAQPETVDEVLELIHEVSDCKFESLDDACDALKKIENLVLEAQAMSQ